MELRREVKEKSGESEKNGILKLLQRKLLS